MKDLKYYLANPSIESWKAVVQAGKGCAGTPTWPGFANIVLAAVESWPKELERKWPIGVGPPEFKNQVEWRIKETDTYGHYAQKIAGDPRLQLDGKQRVWLERRFTGGVVQASSAKQAIATLLEAIKCKSWSLVREAVSVLAGSIRNTGKTGTADLTGGLTIRHTRKSIPGAYGYPSILEQLYPPPINTSGTTESQENAGKGYLESGPLFLEARLEIEVKMGTGQQRPEQIARQNSVISRGGCYLLVRSVEEAVQGILKFIAEQEF